MENYKSAGFHSIGGIKIEKLITEPCYRLSQYGKGLPITCACSSCLKRGQTPEQAKTGMDLIYKKHAI